MPILSTFTLPASASALKILKDEAPLFIAFLASKDPNTGRPWCPDVVAALPVLEKTFQTQDSPQVAFVEVGQRPEWKDPKNVFRTKWNVQSVPTLARFEHVGGQVREVGRLVEGEILDEKRLKGLVDGGLTAHHAS